MRPANMRPLTLLASFLAILSQVICQANNHAIEKRHVSVLARLGELPYGTGKRYVAALAKNGELTSYLRPAWNKKFQEAFENFNEDDDDYEKRYVGSLARSGELRARSSEEKRSGVEGLVRGLATGEELKRLRLEALKEELYRERKEEQQAYVDPDENRSSSFGYISEEDVSSDDEDDESPEKRGGISSLMRNGYPKRTVDDEIERLMSEVYAINDKRNVASIARGSLFPMAFSYPRRFEEEKRNIPSLLRDRSAPLGEGKRHLGSFVRNYGMPYADKRNLATLAKNKDFPYMYMPGKRDSSSADESDETDLSKRYVAALLRQGRLPVGEDASHQDDTKDDISLTQDDSKQESNERKKKSVDELEAKESTRSKREALDDMFGAFGPIKDKTSDDWTSPINKKYFGAKGGGKIPGGRLSTLGGGRRSGRRDNNGRRKGSM